MGAGALSRPDSTRLWTGPRRAVLLLLPLFAVLLGAVDLPAADVTRGSISGRVTDSSGQPLQDICVRAISYSTFTIVDTTSGVDGTYALEDLVPGSYVAVFEDCADGVYADEVYDDKGGYAEASQVAVVADVDTAGIDAALELGGSIAGTVLGADGAPIEGASVSAYGSSVSTKTATTGADGRYTLRGLRTGSYSVRFADRSGGSHLTKVHEAPVSVTAPATTEPIDAVLAVGGVMSGRVTDDTGAALGGVTVAVQPLGPGTYGSAVTATDGTYAVGGLGTGSYRVQFSDPTGARLSEFWNDAVDPSAASFVSVTGGAITPDIDASLTTASTVSGRVTDAAGQPLAGAWVFIQSISGSASSGAVTGADGRYVARGLRAGTYRVQFSHSSGGFASEYWNDQTDWSAASPVLVGIASDTPNVDASLATGGSVSGRVTDTAGNPVSGASVSILSASGVGLGFATSGTDGRYVISGLGAGSYRVQFSHTAGGYLSEYWNDQSSLEAASPVEVVAGVETSNVDASLSSAGGISGRVTDAAGAPLSGVWVAANAISGSGAAGFATTGTDGTYAITALPAGSYRVEFSDSTALHTTEYWNDQYSYGQATPVAVTAGAITSGVDAALSVGGSLSGRVTDAVGTPLSGVWVSAESLSGGPSGSATTGADGRYVVQGLRPGAHRVRFDDSLGGHISEYWNDQVLAQNATPVPVTLGEDTPGVDAALSSGGTISGIVTDEDGTPIAGVWVSAQPVNGSSAGSSTDADGRYAIRGLVAGSYRVQFTDHIHGYVGEYWNDQATYSAATLVHVSTTEETSDIDAQLAAGASLTGAVTDDAGAPLAGITVWARTTEGNYFDGATTTDASGSYSIRGLRAGTYELEFAGRSAGYTDQWWNGQDGQSAADLVVLAAGEQRAGLDAVLEPMGVITGTVTDESGQRLANISVSISTPDGQIVGTAWTRSDGTYRSTGLEGGAHRVKAQDSSRWHLTRWWQSGETASSADEVDVVYGETTTGIDVTLPRSGSISGRVIDAAGVPVPSATVTATSMDGSPVTTLTGSDGRYAVPVGDTGAYTVRFTKDDTVYLPEFWNDRRSSGAADRVAVTRGQVSAGVDATLDRYGSISGRLTNPDGSPIANAVVSASGPSSRSTRSNAEGNYRVDGLDRGTYVVRFTTDQDIRGRVTHSPEYWNDQQSAANATEVAVEFGQDSAGIDAVLTPRPGAIVGRVRSAATGAALSGIRVEVTAGAQTFTSTVNFAAGGSFRVDGVPAGPAHVRFVDPTGAYVDEWWNDVTVEADRTSVVVPPGRDSQSLEVGLTRLGRIAGTVTAPDGTPVQGARIEATGSDGSVAGSTTSASNGTYSLFVQPGTVTVRFSAVGHPTEWHTQKTTAAAASVIDVAYDQDVTGIDARFDPSGAIAGHVTDTLGAPLAGVQVTAVSPDGTFGATTDPTGRYEIDALRVGTYRVSFSSPAHITQWWDDQPTEAAATQVVVAADQVTTAVDATLVSAGAISGRVTDQAGIGLAGLVARADPVDGGSGRSVLTDGDGRYLITGLSAGDHLVTFEGGSGYYSEFHRDATSVADALPVSVSTSGEVTGIDAELTPRPGLVNGAVTGDASGVGLAGITVEATSGDKVRSTTTNGDGRYTIGDVPAGEVRVRFVDTAGVYLTEWWDDSTDAVGSTVVVVPPGGQVDDVDAGLTRIARIAGSVVARSGAPLGAATVEAVRPDGSVAGSTTTAADGAYELFATPGSLRVRFLSEGYETRWYDDRTSGDDAAVLSLGLDEEAVGIDATLDPRPGVVTGVVRGSDTGAGIAGVAVDVWVGDARYSAVTDAAGGYSVENVPAGEAYVQFTDPSSGYESEWWQEAQFVDERRPIVVPPGGRLEGIDATLSRTPGAIAGTVIDATGEPIAGIVVGAGSVSVVTGADGTYVLDDVGPGAHVVTFSDPDARYVTQRSGGANAPDPGAEVSVQVGQVAVVDATLVERTRLSGSVRHDGLGVAAVEVSVLRAGQVVGTTRTDPFGGFAVAPDATGDVIVHFDPPDPSSTGFLPQFYDGANDPSSATPVTLEPGAQVAGIDAELRLQRRPTVSVAVDVAQGVAPHTVELTIEAADPDGDPLSHTIDFGDGTPVVQGEGAPPETVTHTYQGAGTYYAIVTVGDGAFAASAQAAVSVGLAEPLVARAGDDRAVVTDADVVFDGSGSRPALGITSYSWDFGDGRSSSDARATHRYDTPGEYTATLTVRSGSETAVDSATITVDDPPPEPGLRVQVNGRSGALSGAEAFVSRPDGTLLSAVTADDGHAQLTGLPDGDVTVYVWADGHRPAAIQATLADGTGAVEVTLESGDPAEGTLESRRMTYDEIIAAGIDVADPANTNVYEFEIWLNIDPLPITGYVCSSACTGDGVGWGGGWGGGGGGGGDGWMSYGESTCPEVGCAIVLPGGDQMTVSVSHEPGVGPVVHYLVIPGEARFLKEFFEVSLTVQSLAPAPFALTGGRATLHLPDGLSLAPTAKAQQLEQDVASVAAGEKVTATWVVRGDVEGEYDLTATFGAVVSPIGKPFHREFRSSEPLKVWGGSALQMVVDADDLAVIGHPYVVRIGLENVSDHDVYNAAVELKTEGAHNFIYQPRERLTQTTSVIGPGETFWADYRLVPTIGGALDISDSFVLWTAGNVDLADRIVAHDAEPALPTPTTYRYATRDVFEWDAVAGADPTAYQIFRTPDPETQFGPEPVESHPVTGASVAPGESRLRAWVARDPSNEPWWAISPLVDGAPQMRHPLYRAIGDRYPKVAVSRTCDPQNHQLTIGLEDPLFALADLKVELNGETLPTGSWSSVAAADGNTATATLTIPKSELSLAGDDVTIRAVNSEGDESSVTTVRLRSVCARYAALGDSFSSGEGAEDYDWRTVDLRHWMELDVVVEDPSRITNTVTGNSCHRSANAYGPRILTGLVNEPYEDSPNPSDAFLFAACSGAVTEDIRSKAFYPDTAYETPGAEPQLEALGDFAGDAGVDLVTLSIGGNDFGFADIITGCFVQLTSCANDVGQVELLDKVHKEFGVLESTLSLVKAAAGGAPVYVIGYPDLISGDVTDCGIIDQFGLSLTLSERAFTQDTLVPYINHVVSTAADAAGVIYVDVQDAFYDNGTSHRICDPEPWANGVKFGGPKLKALFGVVATAGSGSFHPNARGQQAMYDAFVRQVGDDPTSSANPSATSARPIEPRQYLGRTDLELARLRVTPLGGAEFSVGSTRERTVTVRTSGFAPGSSVTYELHSDPVTLGTVITDANGDAVLETVIPESVPTGIHHVYVAGTGASGLQRVGTATLQLLGAVPSANDDAVSVAKATDLRLDPTLNDTDADGDTLTVEVEGQAEHGVVYAHPEGGLLYRPDADFCGVDEFTYRAFDGQQLSEPATVRVTVRCDELPPEVIVEPGGSTVVDPTDVPTEPGVELDPTTLVIADPPTLGQVEILDGTIVYTAPEGVEGEDSFSYQICDTGGTCHIVEITVVVDAPDVPDVAPTALATATPPAGVAPLGVAFDGRGSSDADGAIVSHEWDFGDGSPVAQGETVSHTYVEPGTYSATLTVRDDDGLSASTSVSVRVDAPPPPRDSVSIRISGAFSYQLQAALTDGDFKVASDSFGLLRVSGRGTVGGATVTVDVSRVLWLPVFVGEVVVNDPAAGIRNVSAPLLLGRVSSTGTPQKLASSASWVTIPRPFQVVPYMIEWEITNRKL
jgi:PKD repeat protein/protocatechuate 3,4-dioxygenase beta subunit